MLDEILPDIGVFFYVLHQTTELGNADNYHKSPVISRDFVFSSYPLDPKGYRETYNWVQYNDVVTADDRYLLKGRNKEGFFDFTISPTLNSKASKQ